MDEFLLKVLGIHDFELSFCLCGQIDVSCHADNLFSTPLNDLWREFLLICDIYAPSHDNFRQGVMNTFSLPFKADSLGFCVWYGSVEVILKTRSQCEIMLTVICLLCVKSRNFLR